MKQTAIHLSEPFEEVLASLLTLPSTLAEIDEVRFPEDDDSGLRKSARCVAEVEEALRSLYEAAHGRQVETPIGFLPIALPVAGFLKKKPYYVATQCEFFLEAFARILVAGSRPRENGSNGASTRQQIAREEPRNKRPQNHTRRVNGNVLLCPTSPRFTSNQQLTRP
jgi:hypothetical protein